MRHEDNERELADAFVRALEAVGLSPGAIEWAHSDAGFDLTVADSATSNVFVVEVKSIATPAAVAAFDNVETAGMKVLISQRISEDLRSELTHRGMGFYDGRGHLRLHAPPLVVDTTVPGLSPALEQQLRLRFEPGALLDVSLAAMIYPKLGVRATAERIRRSPGTVSKNRSLLRQAHLLDADNQPLGTALFDAVAEDWNPVRLPVSALPKLVRGRIDRQLELGSEPDAEVGWALSNLHAAAAWGAPVVVDRSSPPDLYVPSRSAFRAARTLLGPAEYGQHAGAVALAPSMLVCQVDESRPRYNEWHTPARVVAELDLAADPGRGREDLENWRRSQPAEPPADG